MMDDTEIFQNRTVPKPRIPEQGTDYWSLAVAICCISICGIALGITVPLLAIVMETEMKVSTTIIGLNTSVPAVATLIVPFFFAKAVVRVGTRKALLTSLVVSTLCMLLYRVFPFIEAWFVIRLFNGLALAFLFILSETWINEIATDDNRGKLMGLYASCLSLGFAAGPGLLQITGTEGWAPFVATTVVMSIAAVLPVVAGNRVPIFKEEPAAKIGTIIFAAPTAMAAAIAYGAVEMGIFDLLPIYGVRYGFSSEEAALWLTAVGLGNFALQYPIGALADKINRRTVLILCGLIGLSGAVVLPLVINQPSLLYPTLFFWGGGIAGLYTVGLTLLGERYKSSDLAQANAAFVLCYGLGAVAGPPGVGFAMDMTGNHGLELSLAVICGLFLSVGLFRAVSLKKS